MAGKSEAKEDSTINTTSGEADSRKMEADFKFLIFMIKSRFLENVIAAMAISLAAVTVKKSNSAAGIIFIAIISCICGTGTAFGTVIEWDSYNPNTFADGDTVRITSGANNELIALKTVTVISDGEVESDDLYFKIAGEGKVIFGANITGNIHIEPYGDAGEFVFSEDGIAEKLMPQNSETAITVKGGLLKNGIQYDYYNPNYIAAPKPLIIDGGEIRGTVSVYEELIINGGLIDVEDQFAVQGMEPEQDDENIIYPHITVNGGTIRAIRSGNKTNTTRVINTFGDVTVTGGLLEAISEGGNYDRVIMIQGGDEDVYTHNVTISGGIIRASGDENVFLVETNSYTAVNMDISGGEIYSFTGGNLMNVKGEVAVSGGLLFNLHNSYEDIVIDNIIHARSTGALHVSVSGDAVIACFNTNSSNRKLNVLNGAARLGKKDNENGLFYTSGSEERFLAIQALTDDDINVPSSLSPVNANRYAFAGITNGRINLNLPAGEYAAGLYHVDGRMAGKADVKAENGIHTTTLDTHKLPQGVYILNVKQSGISVIKHKIIIR